MSRGGGRSMESQARDIIGQPSTSTAPDPPPPPGTSSGHHPLQGSAEDQQQQPSTSRTTITGPSPSLWSTQRSSSSGRQTSSDTQPEVVSKDVPKISSQQQQRTESVTRQSLTYLAIGDPTSPAFSGGSPTSVTSTHPTHYEILANFATNSTPSFPMKYRNLGKSGLKVPTIALAVWSTFGTKLNDQAAEEMVTAAYESGINYFDTGDGFVGGRSESVLGSILRRKAWRRNTYIVSTKLFWTSGPSVSNTSHPSLSRKFMIEALENSLKRLQLKYVDIVIINKLDGMCPMEEIVRTMAYILDKGYAFYWGTCRWSPVHIMEAFTIARQFNLTPPSVEQMEYHMFTREKMELYMPELYHKLGVGVISWSPTSLNYDDGISLISRRSASSWSGADPIHPPEVRAMRSAKQLQLVPTTSKLGCDYNQLNTAWSLRNENTNCVLIAPRTIDQLHSQLNSLKVLPKLNLSLMEEMDKILENKPQLRRLPSQSNITSPGPLSGSTSNIQAAAGTTTTGAINTTVVTGHDIGPDNAATSV